MISKETRDNAESLAMWTRQLLGQVKDVVPEVVNGHTDAGLDRIAERITDVMSAYDATVVSLGQEAFFEEFLKKLHDRE